MQNDSWLMDKVRRRPYKASKSVQTHQNALPREKSKEAKLYLTVAPMQEQGSYLCWRDLSRFRGDFFGAFAASSSAEILGTITGTGSAGTLSLPSSAAKASKP